MCTIGAAIKPFLNTRHLRPSERVAIAAAVAEKIGERRRRPTEQKVDICPQFPGEKTRDIAAQKSGFGNGKTLDQAKTVVATNDAALIDAMDSGKLSISAAAKAAGEGCISLSHRQTRDRRPP